MAKREEVGPWSPFKEHRPPLPRCREHPDLFYAGLCPSLSVCIDHLETSQHLSKQDESVKIQLIHPFIQTFLYSTLKHSSLCVIMFFVIDFNSTSVWLRLSWGWISQVKQLLEKKISNWRKMPWWKTGFQSVICVGRRTQSTFCWKTFWTFSLERSPTGQ